MSTPPPRERTDIGAIRDLLDQALVTLTRVSDRAIPIEAAVAELEDALHAAYRAHAERANYSAFRDLAAEAQVAGRAALQLLQDVSSDDPEVNEALRLVARAFGGLQHAGYDLDAPPDLPERGSTPPVALATFDEPRLIVTRFQVLEPRVPLRRDSAIEVSLDSEPVDEPPPITSLEELEAAMARSEQALEAFDEPSGKQEAEGERETPPEISEEESLRLRFGVAVPIEEQIAQRAKDCLLELANLGRMRRPTPLEAWASGDETERRLLRRVDAIVACGEQVLPALVEMLEDRPIPDPELTWALIFFFGCLSGDDTFEQAWRIARTVDFSEPDFGRDFVEAVSDALSFALHPRVAGTLESWLIDSEPRRREVAVRALARRKTLTPAQLEAALGDADREVRLAATQVVSSLDIAPSSLLNHALHLDDEAFLRAALWGLSQRKRRAGVKQALQMIANGRPEVGDAAVLAAIAGGEEGRNLLRDTFSREPSPAIIRALGWLGDPQVIGELLGLLEAGDDEQKVAALVALESITGASISETFPEGVSRDVPPFGAKYCEFEPEPDLVDDPEPWRDWWRRHRADVRPNTRYRYGHAYSLRDSLWMLEAEEFNNPQRDVAYTELIAWSGRALPLERDAFIARQRRQLDRWREAIGGLIDKPIGGWDSKLMG